MKKISLFFAFIAIGQIFYAQTIDEFTITKEFAEKINNLYRTGLSFKCYNNGLAKVFNGQGVGFINKNGDVVIPIQYDYVRPLSDGLAVVADKDGHYGVFDSMGNNVIPFRYNLIEDFESGVAWARMGELWGVIDKMGNTVVPFQYSWTYDFYDGVAWVSKSGKLSVIDTKGNIAFDASQYEAFYPFHNGYAWVKKEGRWGLIDKQGKIVIPFSSKQYEEYGYFQDGLIWVMDKQRKYGAIDLRGNIVIPFVYSDFSYFENGLAWAYKNGKWGIINKKGNTVIPFQYNFVCDNCERPAYICETQYVYLQDLYDTEFKDSVAAIKKEEKWGFTNKKGKILVPFQFDIANFDNGLYWVEKDGKEGMIDENGNFITQSRVQYKNIGNYNGKMKILGYSESLYLVEYYTTHNGRHITFSGFMDKNGNCTIAEDIIELQIKN